MNHSVALQLHFDQRFSFENSCGFEIRSLWTENVSDGLTSGAFVSSIFCMLYSYSCKTIPLAISPQLFHSKLKTPLFKKSYPNSSSSPYLSPCLNSKDYPPCIAV